MTFAVKRTIDGIRFLKDEDCCVVMLAVKLARENYRHKRDNIVDGVAYMEILSRIKENNIKA